jgi:hypothetical protein
MHEDNSRNANLRDINFQVQNHQLRVSTYTINWQSSYVTHNWTGTISFSLEPKMTKALSNISFFFLQLATYIAYFYILSPC